MGDGVIHIRNDEHQALRELLPWFVTGQLDAVEQASLDVHVAGCAECQAEVRFQRRLEAEVARLPVDVEEGWSRMRLRLEADQPALEAARPARASARSAWLGWGIAATMALAAGAVALSSMRLPGAPAAGYHALGAAPVSEAGNVVVIFRPDTTEAQMRASLRAVGAQLVGGPTAADAYVLRVAPAGRTQALTTLRARSDIVLAQPVDSGAAP
ncbi:anti-sigma factor [Phenylobacterium sp.]|uniref:anti-sigma factor family protein n=1 Tax=Phenylobacterium sp. TaxID=1871053 RepID=UPI0026005E0B|nr:zf-HC2 domain-containing protein [Phenylobacterium sp.]